MFKLNVFRRIAALLLLLSPPALLASAAAVAGSDQAAMKPAQQQQDSAQRTQPQAPVGHRQPTAADVGAAASPTERDLAQQKRDRALDRKLQICRGC